MSSQPQSQQNQPQPKQTQAANQPGNQGPTGPGDPQMMTQAQTVGATYGFDWSKLWGIVQKLSPALQQVILILLEEANNIPAISAAQTGTYQVNFAEVQGISQKLGIDASDLMAFLSQISPAIAQLLLAILKRQ